MKSKTLYRWSKFVIALMSAVSFSANAGTVGQCKSTANQSIKKAGDAAGADVFIENQNANMALNSIGGNNTINQGAGALQGAANANAANKAQTAQTIQQLLQQCEQACQGPQDENANQSTADEQQQMDQVKNHCKSELEPIISQYSQASGNSAQAAQEAGQTGDASAGGSGGGMSPMMAGLLGAALGAGAAMLLNKKKDKDKDKDKEEDVVDDDGNVNCDADGAEAYSDCNDKYVSKCLTDLNSAACKNFTTRYCTGTSTNTTTPTDGTTVATSKSGVIIASAEDKDIKGEGVGTQYCFTAQATNYCASSGRETCPSCLQLEANKAEACKSNPALCLAQNSPAEIEAAKNSCPSDPMFSDPKYIAGGGDTVNDDGSLADPILPTQYSTSQDSSGGGTETRPEVQTPTPDPTLETPVLPSNGSEVASGGIKSDTSGTGITIASAPSGTAGLASFSVSGSPGGLIGSSPREVASGGNGAKVIAARAPTSVGGSMGPSLFSMSSAMIESRCKTGNLAHCAK